VQSKCSTGRLLPGEFDKQTRRLTRLSKADKFGKPARTSTSNLNNGAWCLKKYEAILGTWYDKTNFELCPT